MQQLGASSETAADDQAAARRRIDVLLPPEVLSSLWPEERLLQGMRVCKTLHTLLHQAATSYCLDGYMRGCACRFCIRRPACAYLGQSCTASLSGGGAAIVSLLLPFTRLRFVVLQPVQVHTRSVSIGASIGETFFCKLLAAQLEMECVQNAGLGSNSSWLGFLACCGTSSAEPGRLTYTATIHEQGTHCRFRGAHDPAATSSCLHYLVG